MPSGEGESENALNVDTASVLFVILGIIKSRVREKF